MRYHPGICSCISEWWDRVAGKEWLIFNDHAIVNFRTLFNADKSNGISKKCFFELYYQLASELLPSMSDSETLQSFAEEWMRDAGSLNAKTMTKEQFSDAIYQLG